VPAGPGRIDDLRSGIPDQFARPPVEDVEEAVFVGLQDDGACGTANLEIGENKFLAGIEIPVVARRRLVIPSEVTGIRVQRYDGSGEQRVLRLSA
jgi:hypothetical protein